MREQEFQTLLFAKKTSLSLRLRQHVSLSREREEAQKKEGADVKLLPPIYRFPTDDLRAKA